MNVSQLLVLHNEHKLTLKEISLVLGVHLSVIESAMSGRIKPKKPKRSWVRSQNRNHYDKRKIY
jgi:hypothetical protein